MACSQAAEFLHSAGGVILRKNYPGISDFTEYDGMKGAGWGGRGLPEKVRELAKEHPVKTVTQINSVSEARDALANGYAVTICSNQGFSSTRDSKGFARPQGNWSHCLSLIGMDDRENQSDGIITNSWGPDWISGPKPDFGIPNGAFLVHAETLESMIRSDGSFSFSSVLGFPPLKLPDYGTEEYL
jgi:hypothetical protein